MDLETLSPSYGVSLIFVWQDFGFWVGLVASGKVGEEELHFPCPQQSIIKLEYEGRASFNMSYHAPHAESREKTQ